MKPVLAILMAVTASTPALAQHADHAMQGHPQPEAVDPHAGHAMPSPDALPEPEPEAVPALDPHASHHMPAPDPHAGHDMPIGEAAPPVAPPPPEALEGPAHAADTLYSPDAMAATRDAIVAEHGGMRVHRISIDRLELQSRKGGDGYVWEDVQFTYGGDIDKLWLKSEGEGTFGRKLKRVEGQALWSHAISPFFDLQTGIRYDARSGPDRAHLVLGVQGLAPYLFEVDAAVFVSDKGDVTARLEGEYDLRITQKLILQPRAEFELAAQDVPELAVGSGLSTAEAGLRLRYQFVPEFAPYIGVGYERAFGQTADFLQANGEDAGGWHLILGIRSWF